MLELTGLAIYSYWGYKIESTPLLKLGLAIVIPLTISVIWGLFISPKASIPLPDSIHLLVEMFILLLPVVLLLSQGRTNLAWIYGLIVLLNRSLLFIWKQ
ncbi:YrdB family protein [Bacillus sp. Bva_UNVM-123]|uniref:YrdB family protein n=1 Tax=Bacillus sp. Bva_UNVM-123 TaxID=2829798 RepID=UPI00391F2B8D